MWITNRIFRPLGRWLLAKARRIWSFANVPPVSVGSPSRAVRVRCPSDMLKQRTAIMRAALPLLPIVECDVVINLPRRMIGRSHDGSELWEGAAQAPIADGKFYIHLWSTPRDSGTCDPPARLFGESYLPLGSSFAAAVLGIPILSPEGWQIGELVDDKNAYIHCQLGGRGSEEVEIFRQVVSRLAQLLEQPAERRAAQFARVPQATRELVRRNFLRLTAGDAVKAIEEAENAVRRATEHADKVREHFIVQVRELDQLKRIKAIDQALLEQEQARLTAEFDEIMGMAQVRWVEVKPNRLEILTQQLSCVHPRTGRTHSIGEFRIVVYLDGGHGGVRWFNLTRPVRIGREQMQAPLVLSDGSAWSLAMTEMFLDFIIERQFFAVASLAIQFIESPDPEAVGVQYIERWPVTRPTEQETIHA